MKTAEAIQKRIEVLEAAIGKLKSQKIANDLDLKTDIDKAYDVDHILRLVNRNREQDKIIEKLMEQRYQTIEALAWVLDEY